MLPMLLAGMGAGLLKSEMVDKPQANRERQLAATTAALSPWTGMTPTMPNEANPLGSMMQGGLAGAQLGQAMQANPTPSMDNKIGAEAAASGNKPGTMIPQAGQAQADFFKKKQQDIMSQGYRPGSEYFMMG